MSLRLKDELRHAGVGVLLGLLGLVFGVFWAVYITVNHEDIHRRLLQVQASSLEEKFVLNSGAGEAIHESHEGHGAPADHSAHADHSMHEAPADHSAHSSHSEADAPEDHSMHDGHANEAAVDSGVALMRAELEQIKKDIAKRAPQTDHHGTPEMADAHERLARAHVHAMGLGILSIALSMLLALIPASPRSKTFAAACIGTGGLFYPLSWILMGMRTTALGSEAAASSVMPMTALSLGLIGLGLLLTLVYVLRWLFSKG